MTKSYLADSIIFMRLIEVNTPALARDFIQVNVQLNQHDKQYIRPLDKDIQEIFDPAKNKTFRQGACIRWLLQDDQGQCIGRIAAFVNKKYRSKGDDGPVGGIGFFDCINDQSAANQLLDQAKNWLVEKGMTAMDGPINFGERDRWWGLVIEGFQEPLYGMNYNPPYYQQLFENYGFDIFFKQICVGMYPKDPLNPKLLERHKVFANDPAYSATHIQKSQLEKYARDFCTVYNKAWAGHGGMKEMKAEQAIILFKKMKPVMDEKIVWFVYHQQEPVGIFVNLPDLNQWFKHLNGKFGFLHKLYFLWLKWTKPNKKFTGLVFGIAPEYQGTGLDAYLIVEAGKVVQSDAVPYIDYEMQWIGDFNPKMLNVAASLSDTYTSRVLATYRYNFDRTKPFKRHPYI
jgi:hypothetical protein